MRDVPPDVFILAAAAVPVLAAETVLASNARVHTPDDIVPPVPDRPNVTRTLAIAAVPISSVPSATASRVAVIRASFIVVS
jgi:hypothetical protein